VPLRPTRLASLTAKNYAAFVKIGNRRSSSRKPTRTAAVQRLDHASRAEAPRPARCARREAKKQFDRRGGRQGRHAAERDVVGERQLQSLSSRRTWSLRAGCMVKTLEPPPFALAFLDDDRRFPILTKAA